MSVLIDLIGSFKPAVQTIYIDRAKSSAPGKYAVTVNTKDGQARVYHAAPTIILKELQEALPEKFDQLDIRISSRADYTRHSMRNTLFSQWIKALTEDYNYILWRKGSLNAFTQGSQESQQTIMVKGAFFQPMLGKTA